MKKKIISSVLLIAFASIVLTACGSSSATKTVENKTVEATAVKEKSQEEVKKEFVDSIKQLRDGNLKLVLDNCLRVSDSQDNANLFSSKDIIQNDIKTTDLIKNDFSKIGEPNEENLKEMYTSLKTIVDTLPELNQARLTYNEIYSAGKDDNNKRNTIISTRNTIVKNLNKLNDILKTS